MTTLTDQPEAELQRSTWSFLSRPILREMRKEFLQKGPDWFEREGDRAVMITVEGQAKIEAAINAKKTPPSSERATTTAKAETTAQPPAAAAHDEKNAPPAITEGMAGWTGKVAVFNHKLANRQVIQCKLSGEALITVRVHDSANYRRTVGMTDKPMMVNVRIERPGLAVVIGRSPRSPGLW